MDLVVDANILFSALIKSGITRNLLIFQRFNLFSAEYIFEEFKNHIKEIEKKIKVGKNELNDLLDMLLLESNITLIPLKKLRPFKDKAIRISPDPNDAIYFAVALKMNCPIWSNDKELKKQKHIKIYSTKDIINKLKKS
jgi:predicted nucleic acid-binding protein